MGISSVELKNVNHKSYVFGGIFLFWVSLMFFSHSLNNGYHFTDDHEIIKIEASLNQSGSTFIGVARDIVVRDFDRRFRPTYYAHRVIKTSLFGSNFLCWSIYSVLLMVLACSMFWFFAVKVGFSTVEALVFSVLPFLGTQSENVWRIGTSEPIGILFMAVALFSIAKSMQARNDYFWNFIFVISTTLMTGSKETFILFVPALLFWKVYIQQQADKSDFLEALKKNIFPITLVAIVVLVEGLFITKYVGRYSIASAGVEGFKPLSYLKAAVQLFVSGGYGVAAVVGAALIILKSNGHQRSVFLKQMLSPVILFTLIMVPQVVIYGKSGIQNRYLVPGIFSYLILLVYMLRYLRLHELNSKFNIGDNLNKIISVVLMVVGVGLILIGLSLSVESINTEILDFIAKIKGRPVGLHWGAKLANLSIIPIFEGGIFVVLSALIHMKGLKAKVFTIPGIIWILISCGSAISLGFAISGAKIHGREGVQSSAFLDSIIDTSDSDELMVVVADPAVDYEWVQSMRIYLGEVGKKQNLYLYKLLSKKDYNATEKRLIPGSGRVYGEMLLENIKDKNQIKLFALNDYVEASFLEDSKSWFAVGEYQREKFGKFIIYRRD